MKRSLLMLSFIFGILFAFAQQPVVSSPTLLPQNPSSKSVIKVICKVTTPNQGVIVDMNTATLNGFTIKIRGCYSNGMLPATQSFIDTLTIGQLAPGNYQVVQIARMSSTQQHCTPIDSGAATLQFQVSQITNLKENNPFVKPSLYPNPCTNQLFVKGLSGEEEISVYSITGDLIRKESQRKGEIDVQDLANGVYLVKIQDANKHQSILKFIKLSKLD